MIPQALVWTWFGVAWLFLAAVAYSRWRAREHRDQQATEEALDRTRQHIGSDHIWDA